MKEKFVLLLIAIITLFFQVTYLVYSQQDFSDRENRMLAMFPKFSIKNILENSFQDDLENALKDQIFKREVMITASKTVKGESKKLINGIYAMFKQNLPKGDTVLTADSDIDPTPEVSGTPADQPGTAVITADGTHSIPVETTVDNSSNDTGSAHILPIPTVSAVTPTQSTPAVSPTVPAQTTPTVSVSVTKPVPTVSAVTPVPKVPNFFLEPVGDVYRINKTDYLTHYPNLDNAANKNSINTKIKQYMEMLRRHSDLKLFIYYVTKSEDLDWFDKSEGIQAFDAASYISARLPDGVRFKNLNFSNLEEYMDQNYKTDHHWNHEGAYRGYKEIYDMLSLDMVLSPVKSPVKVLDFGGLTWIGSKGRESGVSVPSELFKVYDYDYGTHTTYVGTQMKEPGGAANFLSGIIDPDPMADQYKNYFGNEDNKEIIKYVFPGQNNNLMIIGDSNARQIRELIASHFGTTIFVCYNMLQKNKVVENLINQYKITNVLVLDQYLYWFDEKYSFLDYPKS